ncbi:unnamed protein product [Toxocara canis]|uniref:Glycosyltransferase family 92 protein n=1 Tax=Toxocara canis TaxID=6265 RepID=A0A183UWW2_TOXCA|nr:unnamed protein product [Toxocara canis]
MFCISFLITRFDATHVQIYDVADRFDKQPQISDQNVWDRSNRNGGPTRGVKHYEKSTITNLERPSRILRTAIAFNNFSDDVLLYSSFIDYRNGNMDYPCVRMIILKRISASVQLSCRFDEELVEGTFYELAENHLQRYGTYIISCKIPKRLNIDDVNEWILTDGINSANIRAIYRIPKEQSIRSYQFDYGICVPFLFGTTYSGQRLVEFVELNKLLGAQRIIIYTHKRSLARDLQDALVYYSAQRFVKHL